MLHFVISSIFLITSISSQADYCAWNRAGVPVSENNAATYNFINGEFTRDQSYGSGGQTAYFQGKPYYLSATTDCYVPYIWLYWYKDINGNGKWCMASEMGTNPANSFAYCNKATQPNMPDGCNGEWVVGGYTDVSFQILNGNCPQPTCQSLRFNSNANDYFTPNYDSASKTSYGVFDYYAANIWRQASSASSTGEFFLFWNYNTWKWAVNEGITDYANCELYKNNKGFSAVADVNPGDEFAGGSTSPWAASKASPGGYWYFRVYGSNSVRYIQCIGDLPTPAPLASSAPIGFPSNPPTQIDCSQWTVLPPTWAPVCPNLFTPSPVATYFTPSPTAVGYSSTTATPYPTLQGTARPTAPTTAPPTNAAGTAQPTAPTTSSPTSQGLPDPNATPSPTLATTTTSTAAPTDSNGTAQPTLSTTSGSPTTPTMPTTDSTSNNPANYYHVGALLCAIFASLMFAF